MSEFYIILDVHNLFNILFGSQLIIIKKGEKDDATLNK